MITILKQVAYWSFRIINTATGFLMTFLPKEFHESLFRDPPAVYAKLGFSPLAVEMTHNIWTQGWKSRSIHLLIALVCWLAVYAHARTLGHHLNTAAVGIAIGGFESLYITLVITAVVGFLNTIVYFGSK